MNFPIMSIRIGIDPDMIEVGSFVLTWHGFLTFIAVAVAVFLVGKWAKKEGMVTDAIYSVTVWAIIGGIIGTRLLHVIDLNGFYRDNPSQIIQIWEGGITIYGAILGGFVGGASYMIVRNHPRFLEIWNNLFSFTGHNRFTIRGVSLDKDARRQLRDSLEEISPVTAFSADKNVVRVTFEKPMGASELRPSLEQQGQGGAAIYGGRLERAPLPSVGRLADLTTPAILIAMIIGRIGDIINGEHVAKFTSLAWGFVYSNPESPSNQVHGLAASHPAVVYEMILDLAVLAIVWQLRNRLRPYGMLFAMYLGLYSAGRFFISFLRAGDPPMDKIWAIGLTEAHFVAIVVLAVAIPLLVFKAQFVKPTTVTRGRRAKAARGS